MAVMEVIKYNGSKEPYDRNKVLHSLISSGLESVKTDSVLSQIEQSLPSSVSTRELYRAVYQNIKRSGSDKAAKLYRIREALSKIDSIEGHKCSTSR